MSDRDFAYSSAGDHAEARLTLAIYADDTSARDAIRADAELAGFGRIEDAALVDILHSSRDLADCIMLHFDSLSPVDCAALLALDGRLADARSDVAVSVHPDALEDVYGCISECNPAILVAPGRAERLVALGQLMAAAPENRLREDSAGDRETLRQLTEQVAQIAAQIDRLTGGEHSVFKLRSPSDGYRPEDDGERALIRPPRPPLPDPRLVRRIIRQRQLRTQWFEADLFADPAWDILLDLTAARAEHVRVSVTSLCIASGVPPTTALRWIGQMTEAGLLERVEDDSDRRRAFIQLSDKAADAMARYFAELGKEAKGLS